MSNLGEVTKLAIGAISGNPAMMGAARTDAMMGGSAAPDAMMRASQQRNQEGQGSQVKPSPRTSRITGLGSKIDISA